MTTIKLKRRAAGGAAGAPTTLNSGEPAFNEVDDVLYLGIGDNGSGGATSIKAIAGLGAFVDKSTDQTVAGIKTFSSSPAVPTPATSDSSTKAASTAFVKAQGYIAGNQNITVGGDATGSGTTSITLTLKNTGSASTYTKVTTDAQGRVTAGASLAATDIPTLTAAKISDFDTQVRTSRLDQMSVPTAAVSLNSQKITNVADPTAAQDAATKSYVDGVAQGLDIKHSVVAATTANITLSAPQTIDGVAVVAGDRVLVKDQTTANQNGIYVVNAAAWTRSADTDAWTELVSSFVFVEKGTANSDSGWVCTVDSGGTLGTTAIVWSQFSGAGQITPGNGLTKNGNTLDVVGTTNRITVNADSIDIASTYAGQTSITTLGTVTTGTIDGGTF